MSALPPLPLADLSELDSAPVWQALTAAHRCLAELKGLCESLPNRAILIDTLAIQEAKDSSEIENIITSHDELYAGHDDPSQTPTAKQVRYVSALNIGVEAVNRETDFNRKIVIEERERKRVDIFMGQIKQSEKTLVFCASQEHALAVRDYINQIKKSKDPNYCQRVTAKDGELGEQHLRDFQDNEKRSPTILTTSQKLSTGFDARNVRNIVLMRPVNSMIEFKQIIGRGIRLFDG